MFYMQERQPSPSLLFKKILSIMSLGIFLVPFVDVSKTAQ